MGKLEPKVVARVRERLAKPRFRAMTLRVPIELATALDKHIAGLRLGKQRQRKALLITILEDYLRRAGALK